jgi:hypothetical protein
MRQARRGIVGASCLRQVVPKPDVVSCLRSEIHVIPVPLMSDSYLISKSVFV